MPQTTAEKRKFYRHPIQVPIGLTILRQKNRLEARTQNLSLGGLSFITARKIPKGAMIEISIPVKNKLFRVKARAIHLNTLQEGGPYQIGARFFDAPSAFKAKLAEEALEILEYRKAISRQTGQEISEEEAARRWIQEFASVFEENGADSGPTS